MNIEFNSQSHEKFRSNLICIDMHIAPNRAVSCRKTPVGIARDTPHVPFHKMPRLKIKPSDDGIDDGEDDGDYTGVSKLQTVSVRIKPSLRQDILTCDLPGNFENKLAGLVKYYLVNSMDLNAVIEESEASASISNEDSGSPDQSSSSGTLHKIHGLCDSQSAICLSNLLLWNCMQNGALKV